MTAPRILLVVLLLVLPSPAPVAAGHPWMPPLLTIDPESLQQMTLARRPVVAVDVRAAAAFREGRLPGARSIPLGSLTARRRELPADTLVVLYGPAGLEEAVTAYQYLRAAGHANVFVLEGGFAGWRAQGYSIER